ncbi:MAG: NUDIX hydrolase [Chloroflexi bacterium]|nr:NUDIX hydrolase [Chloroflexota bacterium]
MHETILTTKTVYQGRVVTLDVRRVRLPDGQEQQREVVRHQGAVALVALDEQQNVLLVRQYRSGAQQTMLEIPAGLLEPGEAPEVCAARELQEETGFKPARLEHLGGLHPTPGYTTEYIHLYLATGLSEARLTGDADEFIELLRLPFAEALALIERGAITDGKTLVGLLRVARRLGL